MTRHPVETLSLDCSFGSESLAWDQQSRLEDFLRGPAQRVISEVFERHGGGEGVWRLDRLELDLGVLMARDSDAEWALRLERALDEELSRRARVRGEDGNEAATRPADEALPGAARFQSRAARDAESFQQYLDQGVLPWSLRKSTHAEFSGWLDALADQDGPGLLAALAQPSRAKRLEQVLERVLSLDALRALTRARYGPLAGAWDWAEAQPPVQGLPRASREAFQRLWRLNALKAAEASVRGVSAAAPRPSASGAPPLAGLAGEQAVEALAQALEQSAQTVFPESWPALLDGLAPRSAPPELAPLLARLQKNGTKNAAASGPHGAAAPRAEALTPAFADGGRAGTGPDPRGTASALSGPDEIERLVADLERRATPAARLRLAESLQSWNACEAWLRAAPEAGRRRLLRVQFPDAADRLLFWFEERLGADEGGPIPVGERRRRLWAFLLFHLFVEGGGTAPQSLAAALSRWKADSPATTPAPGAPSAPAPGVALPPTIGSLAEAFRRFPGRQEKTEDRPVPAPSLDGPLYAPGSVPPGGPRLWRGQNAEAAQPEADRDRSELLRRVRLRSWRSRVSGLWDEPRLAALIGLLSVPEGVSGPSPEAWDWLPTAIRAESVRLAGLDQGGAALWRRWLWAETLAQAAENAGPSLKEAALSRRWQEAWERLRAPSLEPEARTPRAMPDRPPADAHAEHGPILEPPAARATPGQAAVAFPDAPSAPGQIPGTPPTRPVSEPLPNATPAAASGADAPYGADASAIRPSLTTPAALDGSAAHGPILEPPAARATPGQAAVAFPDAPSATTPAASDAAAEHGPILEPPAARATPGQAAVAFPDAPSAPGQIPGTPPTRPVSEPLPNATPAAASGADAPYGADRRADAAPAGADASAIRPSLTTPAALDGSAARAQIPGTPDAPTPPTAFATGPTPSTERAAAPTALTFSELAELAQPDPLQRLRLMDLLAEPEACEAWLDSSSVEQRWSLLGAYLPLDAARVRAWAGRLPQSPGIESAFWRFLARRLFIEGAQARAEDWAAALQALPGPLIRDTAPAVPDRASKTGIPAPPDRPSSTQTEDRTRNTAADWEHDQAALLRLVRQRAWRFHAAATLDAAVLASLLALLDWKPGAPAPDAGDWSWLAPLLESEAASLAQRFRESVPFWRRWLWATSLSYAAVSARRLTRDSLLRHWAGALERLTASVPAPAPREPRFRPEPPGEAAGRSDAPKDGASTAASLAPTPGAPQAEERPTTPDVKTAGEAAGRSDAAKSGASTMPGFAGTPGTIPAPASGAKMDSAPPPPRPGATTDGAFPMPAPSSASTPLPDPDPSGESAPHPGPAFPDAPRDAVPPAPRPPSAVFSASGPAPASGPGYPARESAPSPAGTPGEPIWVGDAGVVLLGNYLPRLFERLELVRERAFVDEAARERAIHCLDFLVHGSTQSSDPELALAKILSGRPLLVPARPCAGLDEPTRDLLEGLLKAVIAHWSILGGTSVAGLRESFLRREGRLTRPEDDSGGPWTLLVEPRPFDMLLDRLPWSFTPLKLAWMERMIHVEWR